MTIKIKITIPIGTKMGTHKYGVIYIPFECRNLFPRYDEVFTLQTDTGEIKTHLTSKSKAFPEGCYLSGGLRPWFRKQNLDKDNSFVFKIQRHVNEYGKPLREYHLSIQ